MTIKEIAEKAQVSRGTVDRVLNGRSDVSDETRSKVLKIIQELDYKPNVLAKALKSKDKKIQIGIIVSPSSNFFGQDVRRGVEYACRECSNYGVTGNIYEMETFDVASQIKALEKAEADQVNALAVAPMEAPEIKNFLRRIADRIPLVFYNTKLEGIRNLCYIGQDARACGRVAGQMLGLLSHGYGNAAVLLGYQMVQAHMERQQGFREYLKEFLPEMNFIGSFETFEQDERVKALCDDLIRNHSVRNFFLSGGGINGLGAYLKSQGLAGQIHVVCTDFICGTREFLKEDVIQFAIGQQPFEQGYYPVKILTDYLLAGTRPAGKDIYTNLDIRIRENIDYNFSERLSG